jgi:hypothetical protein
MHVFGIKHSKAMCFVPNKRRVFPEHLLTSWKVTADVMLWLASETEILNHSYMKISKGWSLSHVSLSSRVFQLFHRHWIPQEEMVILLSHMKVFLPGIICLDGMRNDWQFFLRRHFLASHQLGYICRVFISTLKRAPE